MVVPKGFWGLRETSAVKHKLCPPTMGMSGESPFMSIHDKALDGTRS